LVRNRWSYAEQMDSLKEEQACIQREIDGFEPYMKIVKLMEKLSHLEPAQKETIIYCTQKHQGMAGRLKHVNDWIAEISRRAALEREGAMRGGPARPEG